MEISRVLKLRAHGGGPPKTPQKILENPSQLDEMPHISPHCGVEISNFTPTRLMPYVTEVCELPLIRNLERGYR